MNRSHLPWIGLALGAFAILYGMLGFWYRGYDNYDRAFIFIATAWLLRQYHTRLIRLPDTPRPRLGITLAIIGSFAFLPPWFVFTQIGPRPIILWWEALALITAAIGVILIRSGPNLLFNVRFLLIFPLFALPLPGRIQNPLHEVMQAISADLGAVLIPLFGVPVLSKDANHIQLSSGGIHVAEVCSGLYMIRTTLSLAALLAHWYRFGPFRGLFLMACSIPVIIIVNAFRVTAFGLLQEWGFPDWVRPGTKHELVGYLAYIPGLLLVLVLVQWLTPTKTEDALPTGIPAQPTKAPTLAATAFLFTSVAAACGLLAVPSVSTSVSNEPDFSKFPTKIAAWNRVEFHHENEPGNLDLPFDEEVKTKLTYNSALNRRYKTDSNIELADVWLIYWKSAMVVKDYHHPDVCFVGSGDRLERASVESVTTPEGRSLPITYREFTGTRGQRKFVAYWTQEGRRVWTTQDESKAASFLFPFYWMKDRINGDRNANQTDDRLVVLIGMPEQPAANKKTLLKFAGQVADETYKLCPWADPGVK